MATKIQTLNPNFQNRLPNLFSILSFFHPLSIQLPVAVRYFARSAEFNRKLDRRYELDFDRAGAILLFFLLFFTGFSFFAYFLYQVAALEAAHSADFTSGCKTAVAKAAVQQSTRSMDSWMASVAHRTPPHPVLNFIFLLTFLNSIHIRDLSSSFHVNRLDFIVPSK